MPKQLPYDPTDRCTLTDGQALLGLDRHVVRQLAIAAGAYLDDPAGNRKPLRLSWLKAEAKRMGVKTEIGGMGGWYPTARRSKAERYADEISTNADVDCGGRV